MTVLTTLCGYFAHEAKTVRERKAIRDWIRADGGYFPATTLGEEIPPQNASWIRTMLGDFDARYITTPEGATDEQFNRVKEYFPDATVRKIVYPRALGGSSYVWPASVRHLPLLLEYRHGPDAQHR